MIFASRIFSSFHNAHITGDIERRLNKLVKEIKDAGGKCWLQSTTNKEHYYELTDPVEINFYFPINIPNKEEKPND